MHVHSFESATQTSNKERLIPDRNPDNNLPIADMHNI